MNNLIRNSGRNGVTPSAVSDTTYIVNNTFAFPNPYRDGQIIISSPLTNSVIANNIFYQPGTAGVLFDTVVPRLITAFEDKGNTGQAQQIVQQMANTI